MGLIHVWGSVAESDILSSGWRGQLLHKIYSFRISAHLANSSSQPLLRSTAFQPWFTSPFDVYTQFQWINNSSLCTKYFCWGIFHILISQSWVFHQIWPVALCCRSVVCACAFGKGTCLPTKFSRKWPTHQCRTCHFPNEPNNTRDEQGKHCEDLSQTLHLWW